MTVLSRRPNRPAIGSQGGGLTVRSVTRADLDANGWVLQAEWDTLETFGYAVERDGMMIAAGHVTWDRVGRAWAWFHCLKPIPGMTIVRCALEGLAMLRGVGEPEIYAIADTSIAAAEPFLERLGFTRAAGMNHELGPVYRCDLSN